MSDFLLLKIKKLKIFQKLNIFDIAVIIGSIFLSIIQLPFLFTSSPYNSGFFKILDWIGIFLFIPVALLKRFLESKLSLINDAANITVCYLITLSVFFFIAAVIRKKVFFGKTQMFLIALFIAIYFFISILSLNKLM